MRSNDGEDLTNGDSVFYKCKDDPRPGILNGKNAKQVLVKHSGTYTRAHVCMLQLDKLTSDCAVMSTESGRPQSNMINCETNEGDPVQSVENKDDATINNNKVLLT